MLLIDKRDPTLLVDCELRSHYGEQYGGSLKNSK